MTVVYALCWFAGLTASMLEWDLEPSLCALAAAVAVIGRLAMTRRWKGLVLCGLILGCASAYGSWQQATNDSRLPESGLGNWSGIVAGPIVVDGDRARFTLRTDGERSELVAVTVRLAAEAERDLARKWRRGDRVALAGKIELPPIARNFDQFDYRRFLERRQIHRMLTVEGLEQISFRRSERISVQAALGSIESYRQLLAREVGGLFPEEQAGLMQGMLIGVRAELEEQLLQQFSKLGLTHILAISGLHVAIVLGGWLGFLRLLRVTREAALNSAFFLIPLYVLISGASPSIVRAGVMAMLVTFAIRRGFMKDALQLLALTGILMTVWNPFYIYDVSFQLSYLVTAGLIVGVPPCRRLLPKRPGWLWSSVAVAIVAQVVSFPLTIAYFNQISLLSGLANLILVPIFSFIALPFGYISLLASFAYQPLGAMIAKPVIWCNDAAFLLIDWLSKLPGMQMIWPSPSFAAIFLYFILLYGIVLGIERWKMQDAELFPWLQRRGKLLAACCFFLLSGWLYAVYGWGSFGKQGMVSFIDVGQGDAIFIQTPGNRTILIDGGGTLRFHKPEDSWRLANDPYEVGKDLLVPLLKKRGVRKIDYLIISHSDADHVGGLAAVIEDIPVKRLLFNGTLKESPAAEAVFHAALQRDIPLYAVKAGQELEIDRETSIRFLMPFEQENVRYEKEQNGISVVCLMDMHQTKFLFTGDMDEAAERMWLEQAADNAIASIPPSTTTTITDPIIDVLKIAHHGSKSSTTELWLDYWKPKIAAISVGARNVYRHPSPIVIQRLIDRKIPILRTDRHGEIQIRVSDKGILYRVKLHT